MGVMQGFYIVLVRVGGALCPREMHKGFKSKATEWKLVRILFICLAFLLFFSTYMYFCE